MRNKTIRTLFALSLVSFASCSQNNNAINNVDGEKSNQKAEIVKTEPHRYGGWYCPDNLNGFPAVDISNWDSVPVVNGRMPSKEETQNGTSLIFVDIEKYPNAKPLDMSMPKLAKYYSNNSRREEIVIVIQAVNVDNDSIVGFRYLNGGNGSARLNEVQFLSGDEIGEIPNSKFVSLKIEINAAREKIWDLLTNSENLSKLEPIFDRENILEADWRNSSNINFYYPNAGELTSSYAGEMYGNLYVQNDFLKYGEKFFLSKNEETDNSELTIVSGPYEDDFEAQKRILDDWVQELKRLSEKED